MEILLRRLVESTGDGVYRYTFSGGVLRYANRGFMRILELEGDPESIIGEKIGNLFIYMEKEGTVREALAAQGEVHNFEYYFKTLQGNDRWVLHNSLARFDPDGDEQVVEAIIKDITPLKQASQAALAAEKEWLSVTLTSIGEAVIATDCEGKVKFLNKIGEHLTGWREAEAKDKSVHYVFNMVREDDPCRRENALSKAVGGRYADDRAGSGILISRRGDQHPVSYRAAPICAHGATIGAVIVFHDITNERRVQEEQILAERLESLGLLAGGIAHDFNNLLTGVLGHISVAKMRASEVFLEKHLQEAEKAGVRARDLAQQLLTFAKGGTPEKRKVDLPSLIREAASFALHGSNCRAAFSFAPDLWPLEADPGQISQVFQNLLLNAQQAMPEGGIVDITASNIPVPDGQSVPTICVKVTDQGTGIPEKYRQRIFDPYFTTKQKGSGIGLSTSYSIIKRHGGQLTVDSVVGMGSTFFVTLPASPLHPSECAVERISLPKPSEGSERLLLTAEGDLPAAGKPSQ